MASVAKRPDGRWRARYRGPDGKERSKHFSRKVDAQRWLDETTSSLLRGEYVDPKRARVTVGDLAGPWLEGRVNLKPKTLVNYESMLRVHVLPTWGSVTLPAVTHSGVVAWVAGLRASGLSASRTRQAFGILSGILEDAVRDQRLVRNPAAAVKLPRLPRAERRYLTHQQVAALADAAGSSSTLVLLLAYCGLRWGEAAALRVRDVDPDVRGRIRVRASITEISGELVEGTPKSHQARAVPIPRFLRAPLAEQLAGKGADEHVFTAPQGGPLRLSNWRRRVFDPAAREIGIEGLTPHELRHTAASLAIASGATIKAVQSMLGHASATLTLDRYGHLFADELDAVADRMDAARSAAAADFLRTAAASTVVAIDATKGSNAV